MVAQAAPCRSNYDDQEWRSNGQVQSTLVQDTSHAKWKDIAEEELFLDMALYLQDGMESDSSYDPSTSSAAGPSRQEGHQDSPPGFGPGLQQSTSVEPIVNFLQGVCHPKQEDQLRLDVPQWDRVAVYEQQMLPCHPLEGQEVGRPRNTLPQCVD